MFRNTQIRTKTDAGRGFQNRPGRFSRLPNRAVFLALRTHSRTLLTIERYWLFKRRIPYAGSEPSNRASAIQRVRGGLRRFSDLKVSIEENRDRALAHNWGQLPPGQSPRGGIYGCCGGAVPNT